MIDTLRTLLRLTLLEVGDPSREALATRLTGISECDWSRVIDELDTHRMTPLIGYILRRLELEGDVPRRARARLRESYRRTLLVSELHSRSLRELLTAFRAAGIEPIVFKGVVLGTGFYPDTGTRPMIDIDVLVGVKELKRAVAALRSLGYRRRGHGDSRNPNGYCNDIGLWIDLHWRFDLYPVASRHEITQELMLPGFGTTPVVTWEPNALVVHLAFHLSGHRRKTGMLLGWMFDLAFVLRGQGDRLSEDRLRQLSPSSDSLVLLWRILSFLDRECGLELPAHLAAAAGRHDGICLSRILREGRLRPWGLPGCVGWIRVITSRLQRGQGARRRYPRFADLPLGVLDVLVERRHARRSGSAIRAAR